jgi:hypothetical protein
MEARNADTQPDPGLPADVLQSRIGCRTGGFTHPTSRQTDGRSFFSSSASFSRASRRMKVSSTVGENVSTVWMERVAPHLLVRRLGHSRFVLGEISLALESWLCAAVLADGGRDLKVT